ncbi:MAG: SDR family oxidoreductase [Lysobacter sp.]|nr:MAG: SDR family oxidoreductase [Lysobacter sp.]
MSSLPLQDKVALVTGGGRGIGRAIAQRLARDGATVVVNYARDAASARSATEAIAAAGGRALAVAGELHDVASVDRFVAALDAALAEANLPARLDILVNNAGVFVPGDFASYSEADFDRQFGVNVKAPFFLTQRLLPRLADGGRIVNVSSIVSRTAVMPEAVHAYAASKGAIDTLTLYLAGIGAARGITVNSVRPGVTETDMAAGLVATDESRGGVKQMQLLQRIGQPDDIAGVVAFLAGPDGGWTTGQYIDASGGTKL